MAAAGMHKSQGSAALQHARFPFLTALFYCLQAQSAYAVQVLWLSLVLTVLLPLARAASLIPFALLHNVWSFERLSSRDVIIIWFSGLMRGAVSVALVYLFFDDNPKEVHGRMHDSQYDGLQLHQATLGLPAGL